MPTTKKMLDLIQSLENSINMIKSLPETIKSEESLKKVERSYIDTMRSDLHEYLKYLD